MKEKNCKDGEYYFISISCSGPEGEGSNEVNTNILAQFHRVIGDFVDVEGNTSQSPIEWFETVTMHEHLYSPYKIKSATFC
jgi:hypothetical protein